MTREPDRFAAVRSTPGLLGYAIAIVVAWIVLSVLVWLLDGVFEPADLFGMAGLVAIFGVVTGPIGALAVHHACDWEPRQWIHVVAAAGVGGVAALAVLVVVVGTPWDGLLRPREWFVLPAAVALSTATGRWLVMPLTGVRRRRAPGDPWWSRWSLR